MVSFLRMAILSSWTVTYFIAKTAVTKREIVLNNIVHTVPTDRPSVLFKTIYDKITKRNIACCYYAISLLL